MKQLLIGKFKYNIQTFGFLSGIKFWIQDIKDARERCSYCGWYLHPQLLFEGVHRPITHTYWEVGNKFICSNCHASR